MTDQRDSALRVPPTWVLEGPAEACTGYGVVVRARATAPGSRHVDLAGVEAWGADEPAAWAKLVERLEQPRADPAPSAGPWDNYEHWREDDSIGGAEAVAAGTDESALRAAYEDARAALPPGWWVTDLSTRYHVASRTPGLWYASAVAPYLRLGDDSELDSRGAWGPDPVSALRALPARFA